MWIAGGRGAQYHFCGVEEASKLTAADDNFAPSLFHVADGQVRLLHYGLPAKEFAINIAFDFRCLAGTFCFMTDWTRLNRSRYDSPFFGLSRAWLKAYVNEPTGVFIGHIALRIAFIGS